MEHPDAVAVILAFGDPLRLDGARMAVASASDLRLAAHAVTPSDVRSVARCQADVFVFDMGLDAAEPGLFADVLRATPARIALYVGHTADECLMRSPAIRGAGTFDCCFRALARGACGCVPRDSRPEKLVHIIRTIGRRESAAAPWLSARPRRSVPCERPISPRELEVIQHVATGATNGRIADDLGIRMQTVKNHIANVARKTGMRSRVELAVFAARYGLIPASFAAVPLHPRDDDRSGSTLGSATVGLSRGR